MSDFLLQMALSNGFIALALALTALAVGAKTKRPHLAHLLWILVLVKLVTPPLVTVPVIAFPGQAEAAVAVNSDLNLGSQAPGDRTTTALAAPEAAGIGTILQRGKPWLIFTWLLGSAIVLVCSLSRVHRFNRLLEATSGAAPPALQTAAERIARRLALKRMPRITTTSAHISPVVWWIGGKVRVVIPSTLIDQMDEKQLELILAHELAHVQRGDYLVRWLEWLACVGFWWNPVVWWAQRNLRAAEEVCCDALVLSSLRPKPRSYANSLLMVVEYLAHPVIRPPAMASEINSGGFLERRIRMIVSEKPSQVQPRWLKICVLLCAMLIIPLGMANAQDHEAVEKRLGRAIEKGELSVRQAAAMMEALDDWGKDEGDWEKDWNDYEGWHDDEDEWEKDWDDDDWDDDKGDWGKDWDKDDDEMAHYDAVINELKEAVETGELTEEEARKKWKAFDLESQKMDVRELEYEKMADRILEAVEAGRISEEEADEKLARLSGEIWHDDDDADDKNVSEEKYAHEVEEIQEALAEGKISKENAREKFEWLRGALAGDDHDEDEHGDHDRDDGDEEHDHEDDDEHDEDDRR